MKILSVIALSVLFVSCSSAPQEENIPQNGPKISAPVFREGSTLIVAKEKGVVFEKGSREILFKYKNVSCELTSQALIVTDETEIHYPLGRIYKYRNHLPIYDRVTGKFKGVASHFYGPDKKHTFSLFCEMEKREANNKQQFKTEQDAYVSFISAHFDAKDLAFTSESFPEDNPHFLKEED